jgi:hypothetical protein
VENDVFIGMRDGAIAEINPTKPTMTTYTGQKRTKLTDAAVSGPSLLAVSGNGHFILAADPDDYRENLAFKRTPDQGEDRALPADRIERGEPNGDKDSNAERFLFWRSDGSVSPTIYDKNGPIRSLTVPTGISFRSASIYGSRALFLDAAGAITVSSLITGETEFSFASIGILDAVLSDERLVLAGKSRAATPNVPLLSIDSVTGETVPIDIGGAAVVRLYRGVSGNVHAIIADTDGSGPKTSIVRLDLAARTKTTSIVEYRAEDVEASIAECSESIATTLGGDGATLARSSTFTPFERTDAIPLRITNNDRYFIAIDTDGGLSWYDPLTGKVLAVLHLYEDRWEIGRNGSWIGGPIL